MSSGPGRAFRLQTAPLCLVKCVCVCVHNAHTHARARTHAHTHKHTHIRSHTHTYIHTRTHTHNTHTNAHTHTHTHTHARTHTYRHTHIHTTHTHTHRWGPMTFVKLTHQAMRQAVARMLQNCEVGTDVKKFISIRVGQNRIYAPYMTVYMVISVPKIPYMHYIYMVLANPTQQTLCPHLCLCVCEQFVLSKYTHTTVCACKGTSHAGKHTRNMCMCIHTQTRAHTHTHTHTYTHTHTQTHIHKHKCTHRPLQPLGQIRASWRA